MNKYHELHNHPMTEQREGIDAENVLVDKEFEELFSQSCEYWDGKHIIVSRSEYEELKNNNKTNKMKIIKVVVERTENNYSTCLDCIEV